MEIVPVPAVPASPMIRLPALTVVLPVYVLMPVSVSVPAPKLLTLPVPEIIPLYEPLSERLKTSAPLFVMLPVIEPDEPLPI